MSFKEEVKYILRQRKERIISLIQKPKITLAERLIQLEKRKRIENILDLLD